MKVKLLIGLLLSLPLATLAGQDSSLLNESDRRFIPPNFRYQMRIESTTRSGAIEETLMKGFKKGTEQNLLVLESPAALSGIVHLRKGPVIWTYYPTLGRSIKTAYQAVALGSAISYGDMIAFSLGEDYHVVETVKDGGSYRLTLLPNPGKEGYAKVQLWIDRQTLLPQRREYFSLSGMMLKSCTIRRLSFDSAGRLESFVQDYTEAFSHRTTTVTISDVRVQGTIPERYFNPASMKFLSGE